MHLGYNQNDVLKVLNKMNKAKTQKFEHIDPLNHPMKIGDYVLYTEVKRSSVFFGRIVDFAKSLVIIQKHNTKSTTRKDTKGVYVITQQYEYNKDKFAEFFI